MSNQDCTKRSAGFFCVFAIFAFLVIKPLAVSAQSQSTQPKLEGTKWKGISKVILVGGMESNTKVRGYPGTFCPAICNDSSDLV